MNPRKLHWYKTVVKRCLNDIQTSIKESKNEMERSYYCTHYAVQLRDFAKALGVHHRHIDKYIKKQQ